MSTTTIRVPTETYTQLQHLAEAGHESIGSIVQRAVEQYEEKLFWQEYHRQAAEIRADPIAWAEWQAELALWDATLLDGLDDDQ